MTKRLDHEIEAHRAVMVRMSVLDRIEQRARERGGEGLGGFVALGVPDVLALANIARAAQRLRYAPGTGLGDDVLVAQEDFYALRAALSAVEETSGTKDTT